MMKKPLVLIGFGLILLVLFLVLPRSLKPTTASNNAPNKAFMASQDTALIRQISKVKEQLSASELKTVDSLEALVKANASNKTNEGLHLKALVEFWDQKMNPGLASHYAKLLAQSTQKEEDWLIAGKRLAALASFFKEEQAGLVEDAKVCFQKALELNPNSNSAKVNLAGLLVEYSQNPMEGITMLRTVVEQDSNNIEAHLNLGFFSIKSGQYDKALLRFEKVLRIDPNYLEAYLYLSECYEAMGDKPKAITNLKLFNTKSQDKVVKEQVERKIELLSK